MIARSDTKRNIPADYPELHALSIGSASQMFLAPLNDCGLTVFAHEKEDILKVLTCRIELARNDQTRMKLFLAENTPLQSPGFLWRRTTVSS